MSAMKGATVAQPRLPVRKIREVLRLKDAGVSERRIAVAIGVVRSTVQDPPLVLGVSTV